METTPTKRVALYIRVSTQEQALEGHSIQHKNKMDDSLPNGWAMKW